MNSPLLKYLCFCFTSYWTRKEGQKLNRKAQASLKTEEVLDHLFDLRRILLVVEWMRHSQLQICKRLELQCTPLKVLDRLAKEQHKKKKLGRQLGLETQPKHQAQSGMPMTQEDEAQFALTLDQEFKNRHHGTQIEMK